MTDDYDKLAVMFSVMEDQQAAVNSAIAGLAQERKAMAAAIDAIKSTSGTLQKATGDAAARAVVESIGQAPKTAVAALNQAVGALDEAAGQVRSAGAWLTFKAAASVAGAGLVMVLAMYVLGRFMLPSEAEVQRLRAEKAELETAIADLTKRGGKIKFNTCDGRLCIQANSNQGKDANGNPTPIGGWRTTDGRDVALVIEPVGNFV
ncbi:cell division protein FtsB [Oxalobacteraceae bacterium GrIS 1.11]